MKIQQQKHVEHDNMRFTNACVTLTVDLHNELEIKGAFDWFICVHHLGQNFKWLAVGLLH